jgi:hypothetical protein
MKSIHYVEKRGISRKKRNIEIKKINITQNTLIYIHFAPDSAQITNMEKM